MVDQLQERIEREARFNSDVSHELRSPLTTLAASLEVLEADRDQLPPRSQRGPAAPGRRPAPLPAHGGDLLEMSRADAGSVDVFLEEVNVVRAGAALGGGRVRAHGRPQAGGAPDGAASTPAVRTAVRTSVGVDKRRFERVMVNLMENAAHYGGGVTRDRGRARRDGDQVEVTVDDAGPGIDPAERTEGLRALLPGLGLGPAGHRHRDRARAGAGGRAHARHAAATCASSSPAGRGPLRAHPAGAHRRRRPRRRGRGDAWRAPTAASAVVAAVLLALRRWPGAPSRRRARRARSRRRKVPFDLLDPHLPTTTTTQPKPSSYVPVKVFFLNPTDQLAARATAWCAARPHPRVDPHRAAGGADAGRDGQRHHHRDPDNVAVLVRDHAGQHRHGEHEQRLRPDHREQHRARGRADRGHGGERDRARAPG